MFSLRRVLFARNGVRGGGVGNRVVGRMSSGARVLIENSSSKSIQHMMPLSQRRFVSFFSTSSLDVRDSETYRIYIVRVFFFFFFVTIHAHTYNNTEIESKYGCV